jgi:hypothetical protein
MTTTVASADWRFTADEPDDRRGGTGLTVRAVDARGAAAEARVDVAECTHQGRLSMRIGPVVPPAGVLGTLVRLGGSMAAEYGARTLHLHFHPDNELAAEVLAESGLQWTVHEGCEGDTAVAALDAPRT